MSHGKQFTLFTHKVGPNGWKVAIVLEELGLTYEPVYLDFQKGEQKAPEYTKYNPNGRIPALIDHHNNDYVLWESCAILVYLVNKYDPEHKISASSEADKDQQLQYLFFQSSGQGPYFGQVFWFAKWHPERIPSAVERYKKEILRVFGVLDGILAKQEWLICGKPTIADFAFITWNRNAIDYLVADEKPVDVAKEFPALSAWQAKLEARDAIRKVLDEKLKA